MFKINQTDSIQKQKKCKTQKVLKNLNKNRKIHLFLGDLKAKTQKNNKSFSS